MVVRIPRSLDLFHDLRSRSRDLVRNNPLASKAVNTLTTNIVGHGVKVKFVGTGAKSVQDVWNKWAKSTYCDFDGMMCFYSLAGACDALCYREWGMPC